MEPSEKMARGRVVAPHRQQAYRNVKVGLTTPAQEDPLRADTGTARTMQIGELAERTGLSLRTIRHYDEIGLLRASGRSEGGFRLYTDADLERLMLIRRMKPLGFSLDEMGEVLTLVEALGAGKRSKAELRNRLKLVIAAAEARRAQLAEQLAMADEFITLLRGQPQRLS
jgi:MerR family copper efflux transcriptional regulator